MPFFTKFIVEKLNVIVGLDQKYWNHLLLRWQKDPLPLCFDLLTKNLPVVPPYAFNGY